MWEGEVGVEGENEKREGRKGVALGLIVERSVNVLLFLLVSGAVYG